jgi:hypothetical protein
MKINLTENTTKEYKISTSDYKYSVELKITDGFIEINNYYGRGFVFQNIKNKETLEKWKKVVGLINEAIKIAEKELKQK